MKKLFTFIYSLNSPEKTLKYLSESDNNTNEMFEEFDSLQRLVKNCEKGPGENVIRNIIAFSKSYNVIKLSDFKDAELILN
ncbi:MAG: hypothetical protein KAT68_01895 [Bacteroidales bacterium]|nr:hypothetical protein [Bacteroidales bacterium]